MSVEEVSDEERILDAAHELAALFQDFGGGEQEYYFRIARHADVLAKSVIAYFSKPPLQHLAEQAE